MFLMEGRRLRKMELPDRTVLLVLFVPAVRKDSALFRVAECDACAGDPAEPSPGDACTPSWRLLRLWRLIVR